MYLVDTNIFLEVLLGRAGKERCKEFLRELRDGKKGAVVTDFSIHSIIVILDGLGGLEALKNFF
ncbi:MAG: hypothetical protein QXI91_02810 [Candidatus Bathyarchaeia archaeon]